MVTIKLHIANKKKGEKKKHGRCIFLSQMFFSFKCILDSLQAKNVRILNFSTRAVLTTNTKKQPYTQYFHNNRKIPYNRPHT